MIKIFDTNVGAIAATSKKDALTICKSVTLSAKYTHTIIKDCVLYGVKKRGKDIINVMTENVEFDVMFDTSKVSQGLIIRRSKSDDTFKSVLTSSEDYLNSVKGIVNDPIATLSLSEADKKRDELWSV